MKLTQKKLDEYVQMVVDGWGDRDIQESWSCSYNEWKKLQPQLLFYFRKKMKEETAAKLAANQIPDSIPLTEPLREKFIDCVRSGLGYDKASRICNVPIPVVFDFWFKFNPDFKNEVEMAVEEANVRVEKALYRRAVGFEFTTRTASKNTQSGISLQGAPVNTVSETTTEGTKVVIGDVRAQEMWLTNRNPDRWKTNPDMGNGSNKGKILEALDAMTKISESEFEAIDKENDADI